MRFIPKQQKNLHGDKRFYKCTCFFYSFTFYLFFNFIMLLFFSTFFNFALICTNVYMLQVKSDFRLIFFNLG